MWHWSHYCSTENQYFSNGLVIQCKALHGHAPSYISDLSQLSPAALYLPPFRFWWQLMLCRCKCVHLTCDMWAMEIISRTALHALIQNKERQDLLLWAQFTTLFKLAPACLCVLHISLCFSSCHIRSETQSPNHSNRRSGPKHRICTGQGLPTANKTQGKYPWDSPTHSSRM